MKMVIALISRDQIEAIANSLTLLGVSGMTLIDVKCSISDNESSEAVKLPQYKPKTKIEIAINDDKVDQLVDILLKEDADADITVDKICVMDIKDSMRIRTSEKGDKSL